MIAKSGLLISQWCLRKNVLLNVNSSIWHENATECVLRLLVFECHQKVYMFYLSDL